MILWYRFNIVLLEQYIPDTFWHSIYRTLMWPEHETPVHQPTTTQGHYRNTQKDSVQPFVKCEIWGFHSNSFENGTWLAGLVLPCVLKVQDTFKLLTKPKPNKSHPERYESSFAENSAYCHVLFTRDTVKKCERLMCIHFLKSEMFHQQPVNICDAYLLR
jgi:hypothetical protein